MPCGGSIPATTRNAKYSSPAAIERLKYHPGDAEQRLLVSKLDIAVREREQEILNRNSSAKSMLTQPRVGRRTVAIRQPSLVWAGERRNRSLEREDAFVKIAPRRCQPGARAAVAQQIPHVVGHVVELMHITQAHGAGFIPERFGQMAACRNQGYAETQRRHRRGSPRTDAVWIRLHQNVTRRHVNGERRILEYTGCQRRPSSSGMTLHKRAAELAAACADKKHVRIRAQPQNLGNQYVEHTGDIASVCTKMADKRAAARREASRERADVLFGGTDESARQSAATQTARRRPSAYGFNLRSHAGIEIQTYDAARNSTAVMTRWTTAASVCRHVPSQNARNGSWTISSTVSPMRRAGAIATSRTAGSSSVVRTRAAPTARTTGADLETVELFVCAREVGAIEMLERPVHVKFAA